MNRTLLDYFRCPDYLVDFSRGTDLSADEGFFRFGHDTICYGQHSGNSPSKQITHRLIDASRAVRFDRREVRLPFDFSQVVDNLRHERYSQGSQNGTQSITERRISRQIYYFLRPILGVRVRKYLQRMYLRGWEHLPFPQWPVDFTVDLLMERALALVLKSCDLKRIPFIWFWPEGAPSCVIMTHDVEAIAGRNFCGQLMNMDDSFGIKSSFQIVPEARYESGKEFLNNICSKGFEVNVHDLNHDGALFQEKEEFLRRAELINRYAREFHAQGFRAGAMYRNQEWFGAFTFSYDMSVPNVARLEPQQGGCCTVMPYFIGSILELPLTTVQDYSLFHILGDYSIELWKQQIEMIQKKSGLISFITHPDYLIEKRAQDVYRNLLAYLAQLRTERKLWLALPGSVDRWWRSRNAMSLVPTGDSWRIEGPDKHRARVAYASLQGDRVVYSMD
jgi:hypothetical protein